MHALAQMAIRPPLLHVLHVFKNKGHLLKTLLVIAYNFAV